MARPFFGKPFFGARQYCTPTTSSSGGISQIASVFLGSALLPCMCPVEQTSDIHGHFVDVVTLFKTPISSKRMSYAFSLSCTASGTFLNGVCPQFFGSVRRMCSKALREQPKQGIESAESKRASWTLGGTASARALLGTQPEMDDISSKGRNFQSRKTAYTCSAIWSSPHNACIRPVVKYFFLYRHNHLGSFTSLRLSGVARLEWEHFNCNFKDQKKLAKSDSTYRYVQAHLDAAHITRACLDR